jgi:sulfoxide reductase heme-binding subunit YedZ
MLIPLAVTSTDRAIRRLGKRWKSLHRTVYIIGVLAVFHFLFLVKADFRDPLIYAAILVLLLLVRSTWWAKTAGAWRKTVSKRSAPSV